MRRNVVATSQCLLRNALNWYHHVQGHCGIDRLVQSLSTPFFHPNIHHESRALVTSCDPCQRYKLPGRGQGELPPYNVVDMPFDTVAVDLIGPWEVTLRSEDNHAIKHTFFCIEQLIVKRIPK